MNKKSTQEKSKDAIRATCHTAIMVDDVLGDNGVNLMPDLEQAAEAIQDKEIMGEYKDKTRASKILKVGELEEVKAQDLENEQDILYLVCDKLEGPPKEIIKIESLDEIIYLLKP